MSSGKITVEGRATFHVPADHADISFTVSRRAATTGDAVTAAGAAYATLDRALSGHASVIVRRSMTSLVVQEIVRYDPTTGTNTREGFSASRTETVRFAPIDRAGDALRAAVVAVPELAVAGPHFGLDPENPVHDAVRAAAAADARRAAEAYASGIGARLGAVRRLREPADRDLVYDRGPRMMAMAKGAAGEAGETVLVDLTGEEVELTAVIELVAELEV